MCLLLKVNLNNKYCNIKARPGFMFIASKFKSKVLPASRVCPFENQKMKQLYMNLASFLKNKSQGNAVNLLSIGALTKESKGHELAELFDMKTAGAVAFGDYKKAQTNPNLMKIALQYASNFNGLVCSFPQENAIALNGVMNEHITSTSIGLKGIPALAEELQIVRDLFLLEYTEGKLHIPTISTAKSVELIREAKDERDNILKEARSLKDKMIHEAKDKAQVTADSIVENARERIESEKKAALVEIKNTIASYSIEIAEKILREELKDKKRQTAYVEKLLKETSLN